MSKYEIVSLFYNLEDDNFFTNIHKRHGTKEECINDTCSSIGDDSEIYEVWFENKLAAYFVKYRDEYNGLALEGFHVKKEFRNREFLSFFGNIIKSKFDTDFYTGIYEKNLPALNFLTKMGMEVMNKVTFKGKSFFIFKCQN